MMTPAWYQGQLILSIFIIIRVFCMCCWNWACFITYQDSTIWRKSCSIMLQMIWGVLEHICQKCSKKVPQCDTKRLRARDRQICFFTWQRRCLSHEPCKFPQCPSCVSHVSCALFSHNTDVKSLRYRIVLLEFREMMRWTVTVATK